MRGFCNNFNGGGLVFLFIVICVFYVNKIFTVYRSAALFNTVPKASRSARLVDTSPTISLDSNTSTTVTFKLGAPTAAFNSGISIYMIPVVSRSTALVNTAPKVVGSDALVETTPTVSLDFNTSTTVTLTSGTPTVASN